MQFNELERQLNFLREIDCLKSIVRQSPLLNKSRKENSAEHSWHLAMYAMLLNEYAAGLVDINRVIKMLLIHDIVEIDIGDFPIHTEPSIEVQALHEEKQQSVYLVCYQSTKVESYWTFGKSLNLLRLRMQSLQKR